MKKFKDTIFIFDVDSTLARTETLEGIIEIAIDDAGVAEGIKKRNRLMKQIQKITNLGMEGRLDFTKSLEERFEVVQILQKHIDLYNSKILPQFIDLHFKNVVKFIGNAGGSVFVVSAGFMDSVKVVVDELNISRENCFANEFIRNNDMVVGFNKNNPLATSTGKVKIVMEIKDKYPNGKVICIGDGNSDYLIKAEGVADEFWGFWGNVQRDSLIKKADRNFYSSQGLLKFVKE